MEKLQNSTAAHVLMWILLLGVCVAYVSWLDSGCQLAGAMTWEGKVCVM